MILKNWIDYKAFVKQKGGKNILSKLPKPMDMTFSENLLHKIRDVMKYAKVMIFLP
jgi:hypothetical protein